MRLCVFREIVLFRQAHPRPRGAWSPSGPSLYALQAGRCVGLPVARSESALVRAVTQSPRHHFGLCTLTSTGFTLVGLDRQTDRHTSKRSCPRHAARSVVDRRPETRRFFAAQATSMRFMHHDTRGLTRYHRLTTGPLAAKARALSIRPIDPCVPYLPAS